MIGNANILARRIPRQHRSRQTVEAVLAAVPLVLKRHGVASITTNRIAEVAGVSIGSLYQYFPDKSSVFSALHERHVGDVRNILERNIAAPKSSSFRELVVDLVEELVDLHSVETELHQLVSASVDQGPEHFRRALRAVFERAMAQCGSENMNRILFVLPSLVEGVVHGVTLSPLTSSQAKGEAVKATLAYLSAHPELGR
ncbi:TetR/AcrR family transcriptional regulator [Rhizobium leucaenae]|uniref:AcrR family transcriptional regulator n=1 Tax=Rhizobium leucaenae TaxID=29450 RepID=A0A7W7EN45_9HYPH|nr:TetR/AcrR family transcriptional regulator [Rhizobium leucaenae]MBB4571199.1 AcrR family transcriptional regulator [Rhizobium leucaenae]MBB6304069.1 AcrR family transcriptional regulator [Rhizobium leucaenae]